MIQPIFLLRYNNKTKSEKSRLLLPAEQRTGSAAAAAVLAAPRRECGGTKNNTHTKMKIITARNGLVGVTIIEKGQMRWYVPVSGMYT